MRVLCTFHLDNREVVTFVRVVAAGDESDLEVLRRVTLEIEDHLREFPTISGISDETLVSISSDRYVWFDVKKLA